MQEPATIVSLMSATRNSTPFHQPIHRYPVSCPVQTQYPPLDDIGQVVFTRQLWKRNMPEENQSEQGVLNKSQNAGSQSTRGTTSTSSRRTSSAVSLRPRNRSPSPSRGSKTPLTPEESPPFRTTRKRSAGLVEQEDKAINSSETSPAHKITSSGEPTVHVCILPARPKDSKAS